MPRRVQPRLSSTLIMFLCMRNAPGRILYSFRLIPPHGVRRCSRYNGWRLEKQWKWREREVWRAFFTVRYKCIHQAWKQIPYGSGEGELLWNEGWVKRTRQMFASHICFSVCEHQCAVADHRALSGERQLGSYAVWKKVWKTCEFHLFFMDSDKEAKSMGGKRPT